MRTRHLGLIACAVTVMILSVTAPASASPTDSRIERDALAAMRAAALGGDATLHVRHIASDATVADDGARERQTPASTMKVVTAATSLVTLGERHRFVTAVKSSTKSDHVVLVGGGDPLLASTDLLKLAKRTARNLSASGSVTVDVDDYLFPRPTDAEGWEPGDRPTYASAVRPLGLLGSYSNDTVATAWSTFVQALRSRGVDARMGERLLAADDAPLIAQVRPHTVRDAVGVMLRVSENNVAEVLFRHVALARGYPATWTASSSAAKEVLRGMGVPTWRLALVDGSGLSGSNRLTAESLTHILDISLSTPGLDALIDGLPIAGRTGTLTYRFSSPPASCARGEVAAKTGSLTGVSTLAGVTQGPDGQWRSFAIMVNQRPSAYPTSATSLAIDTVAAIVQGCA
jgi:D-alanyl-D-alanine carboxypeptidase/D-alanyl-D-alanine-endopeptidase (penicillin-binding protein 4)